MIADNIIFLLPDGRTGWLRVEAFVAGCLGAPNSLHCLIAGSTTIEDVLQGFGPPVSSNME
jgi:hypothetical protein